MTVESTAVLNRNQVGVSEVSRLKWERLAVFMDIHIKMVKGALKSCRKGKNDALQSYFYVDLYAGPGLYQMKHDPELAGEIGSPLIAVRKLKSAGIGTSRDGLGLAPYLADADRDTCDDLRRSLLQDGHPELADRVTFACCARSVDMLAGYSTRGNKYGLVFVDPNGYPDWDAVRLLGRSPHWYRVDMLINVNATIHKRCRGSSTHAEEKRPTEYLRDIGKQHVSLWNPAPGDHHQFTLAYCTNYKSIEFNRQGFHDLDSPKGQALARLIDYSAKERALLPPIPGMLPGLDWDAAVLGRDKPNGKANGHTKEAS